MGMTGAILSSSMVAWSGLRRATDEFMSNDR